MPASQPPRSTANDPALRAGATALPDLEEPRINLDTPGAFAYCAASYYGKSCGVLMNPNSCHCPRSANHERINEELDRKQVRTARSGR